MGYILLLWLVTEFTICVFFSMKYTHENVKIHMKWHIFTMHESYMSNFQTKLAHQSRILTEIGYRINHMSIINFSYFTYELGVICVIFLSKYLKNRAMHWVSKLFKCQIFVCRWPHILDEWISSIRDSKKQQNLVWEKLLWDRERINPKKAFKWKILVSGQEGSEWWVHSKTDYVIILSRL